MKLVAFIVASLYAVTAVADPHSVEQLRKQYELDSDPAILVRIAHEFRKAGDQREALAYFCSYMYVDAAGPLADEASANARAIAAQMGKPTQSDHEACSTRPPATRETTSGTQEPNLALYTTVSVAPKGISRREIIGLSGLGGSLVFLGLSLWEGDKLRDIHKQQRTDDPTVDQDALADREGSASLRQKLYLIAGGATLITGGILYVTGLNARKKAERTLVAPTVSKNSAGLTLGRRF
jgi:hypothetical protein